MVETPSVGVAGIIRRGKTVLLGERIGSHGAGCWGFPGGHLEIGESIEECIRREVLEETGLQLSDIHHAGFTNDLFAKEHKHYVTLFVTANAPEGEARVLEPNKCRRWAWYDWDALPEPLFLPIRNLKAQGYRLPDE